MRLVVVLSVVDVAGAAYLFWYARSRERRSPSSVAVVGVWLLLCAAFLGHVAWRSGHPVERPHGVPAEADSL